MTKRKNTNEEKNLLNVGIYSRKSKYTGKGESIGNQIEMSKEYLRVNFPDQYPNMNIFEYEDEGYSGGNVNRPHFQRMIEDIKSKKIDSVICYRLDRISRNTRDFLETIDLINKYDINFISIRDRFDTSTSMGYAMMMMVSVFAQLERDTIAERIKDNMHELAKTGRWLGGTTPTGYKSVSVDKIDFDGKKRSSFKLDIINDEIEIVKLIFSKFLETNSLSKTETFLLNERIKTKKGKEFNRFSIRNILENPVYMINDIDAWNYFNDFDIDIYSNKEEFDGNNGMIAYNKTEQTYGKSNKTNDIEDWIVSIGKHKGIINGSDWVKVQKMLSQNKDKSWRKPKSNIALLSGLLRCGDCGDFMRPKQHNRFNSEGEKVYYYLCETKEKSQKQLCEIPNLNGNILDKSIIEEIKKLSGDNSTFLKELKHAKKTVSNNVVEYQDKIKNFEKEIQKNEDKIQRLVVSLTDEKNISEEYIKREIENLHNENQTLLDKIEDVKCLTRDYSYSDNEFDILRDMINSFGKTIDFMTIEEKRFAIRAVIRRIVVSGEDVHIYFFGSKDERIDFPNFELPKKNEIMLPFSKDRK